MTPIIEIRNLRKTYGSVVAADDISLEVQPSEIFGLLGPNGAGKTTTLECLEGIRQPDRGGLAIQGVDPTRQPQKLRNLIGVQLQTGGLPDAMTVDEALRFFAAYHGIAPRRDLLSRMGLADKLTVQYHQLSVGLRRRLALALAITHDPPVVILDEPTAGLDVASRTELHALMAELRAGGTAILLATHDMAEAEKLADRVAILLAGRIVATGSPHDLTATGAGLTKISVRSEEALLLRENGRFPAVQEQLVKEDYAIYFSADPGRTVTAILDYLRERADRLIDLRVERPSLEERFLEITGVGTQPAADPLGGHR